MAKCSRKTSERTITRRLREGRGQGRGATYKPWLTVQDVPSQGLSHRIKGWTTQRVHHLFSNLERDAFYLLDWAEVVVDIREQYPLLPLQETEGIAEQMGVRHPEDPRTGHSVVMTTDFLVDVQGTGGIIQQAHTVKPAEMLDNPRTLEKLEIERRYWQSRDVDWGIVTEYEIPTPQTHNVRLLHGYQQIDDRLPAEVDVSEVVRFLLDNSHARLIAELAQYGDHVLNLASGTTLTVLYHLLATRRMAFNLSEPLAEQMLLPSFGEVSA